MGFDAALRRIRAVCTHLRGDLLDARAFIVVTISFFGFALLLLGCALLVGELLLPTFGVLGVAGLLALGAGGMLLSGHGAAGLGVPLAWILAFAVVVIAAVLVALGMALRARRQAVVSGREQLLNATGEVIEVEGREAWARVLGERWEVRSEQPLVPGQQVRVLGLNGLTLDVRPEPNASRTN